MGGDVWLDESYDSGVPGCPGARFVIDLNTPPLHLDDDDEGSAGGGEMSPNRTTLDVLQESVKDQLVSKQSENSTAATSTSSELILPDNLRVLFV